MSWDALPGDKVRYEVDGTVVFGYTANTAPAVLTEAQRRTANGLMVSDGVWQSTDSWYAQSFVVVLFPQLRDLKGFYCGGSMAAERIQFVGPFYLHTSADTTTGQDGTWTQRATWGTNELGTWWGWNAHAVWRTQYRSVSVSGVRAVRLTATSGSNNVMGMPYFRHLHVYADIPNSTGERLQMWHPTLNQPLRTADMDMGDVTRNPLLANNSTTKTFRVKNMSATYTATGISVAKDAATNLGAANTYTDGFKVSPDNSTWADSFTISNLAPGAISPVLYVRLVVPTDAVMGPFDPFVKATPTDWT